jgi:ribosomal protein S6
MFVLSLVQVAKTALKAGGEVLNVAAWGKIKLGYKAVKYAATGYRLSEQVVVPSNYAPKCIHMHICTYSVVNRVANLVS